MFMNKSLIAVVHNKFDVIVVTILQRSHIRKSPQMKNISC